MNGYQVSFERLPDFLHAVVTGRNTADNVRNYFLEVVRESDAHGYVRLLIEERLEGPRLDLAEVFGIAEGGSLRFMLRFEAIAYVDVNAAGGHMEFAETVAANRGFPLRVLPTVEAARGWLASLPPPRPPGD